MVALILSLISLLLCVFGKGVICLIITLILSITALIMARKGAKKQEKYTKATTIISIIVIAILAISFLCGLIIPIITTANDFVNLVK